MPKQILTILTVLSLAFFTTAPVKASWLDKLKETATELTDKAGEALKEADPEAPTTSDGEGQPQSPTTASPAKPAAPETQTVTKPSVPKVSPVVETGNNDPVLVKATQEELKRLGYSISADGAYGPNTRKQIIAFEQSQSLSPSGDASVELLAKLKETPTPKAAEPAPTAAAAPAPKAEEPKAETVLTSKTEEPKETAPKIEKAAASTPMTTAVAASAPKYPLTREGKLALEQCEQDQIGQTFYSCQCVAENTERFIEPQIDSQTSVWKKRVTGYEAAIKKNNANPNFTAAKKTQMEDGMRQQIKRAEDEIAKIEDRGSWNDKTQRSIVKNAIVNVYKEPICKIGENWHKKEYDECLKSPSSKNIQGKTPEKYCSCSADMVARLWTSSDRAYGSKVAVGLPTQARAQCRK